MSITEPDAQFWRILGDVLPDLPRPAAEDADLWSYGMDSLATIQLLVELEQSYSIEFRDDQLTPDSFGTPAALWAVVVKQSTTD